ncbi:MAG: RNA polymerase sigma-70 factor [Bacteroides nordii]|jgi:RNA polymerase sigma-70 factor
MDPYHIETELLIQLRNGEHNAFRRLFDLYYALMCAIAYEYIEDEYICQGIAEDVLLSVWEKRKQLDINISLKGYLIRSVRNRSIDYLRSNVQETKVVRMNTIDEYETCFIADEELFDKIALLELEDKIEEIVSTLPVECRTVFQMSRFEGLSNQEIAERLNISINTVKYHIKKALSVLKEGLGDYLFAIVVAFVFLFRH